MGEVAMIAGGDAEHADDVGHAAQDDGVDVHADEEDGEAGEVKQDERGGLEPVGDDGATPRSVQEITRPGGGPDGAVSSDATTPSWGQSKVANPWRGPTPRASAGT
jgi:hypothetical protein